MSMAQIREAVVLGKQLAAKSFAATHDDVTDG